MDTIYIYCDGGCRGNHFKDKTLSIGGFGIVMYYKNYVGEFYGWKKNTTNNIMELTSAIRALEVITKKYIPIIVTMDSAYVIQGINEYIDSWIRNSWINSHNKPIKNKDLWLKFYELTKTFKDIKFVKCKGHATNEGNIRADQLANIAMDEASQKLHTL